MQQLKEYLKRGKKKNQSMAFMLTFEQH